MARLVFFQTDFDIVYNGGRVIGSEGGGGSEIRTTVFSRRVDHLDECYLLVLESASRGLKGRTQPLSLLQKSGSPCSEVEPCRYRDLDVLAIYLGPNASR